MSFLNFRKIHFNFLLVIIRSDEKAKKYTKDEHSRSWAFFNFGPYCYTFLLFLLGQRLIPNILTKGWKKVHYTPRIQTVFQEWSYALVLSNRPVQRARFWRVTEVYNLRHMLIPFLRQKLEIQQNFRPYDQSNIIQFLLMVMVVLKFYGFI